jgi:hypothetical protein
VRRRRTSQLVLLAALCGGAALGCGSDPGAEPAPPDGRSWESEVGDGCAELNERHAELASMAPGDDADARRHAAAVAAFTEDYAEVLEAVDDPADDGAAGRAVRQLAKRFAAAGRELDEAARSGDATAAERAVGRLDRRGAALDVLLEPWDLEACRMFGGGVVTTP